MSWPKIPVRREGWLVEEVPTTRCKHGAGACETCGTTDRRDVIHTRRTPTKKEARRKRRESRD